MDFGFGFGFGFDYLPQSLESCFGFISVLPGAFSAYRYDAIREKNGEGPLVAYFTSIEQTPQVVYR